MSRFTLGCALSAAVLSALAVAGQRVGLALSVVALLVLVVAVRSGPSVRGRGALAVAGAGLALQPLLHDAGWILAADVPGVLLAAGAIVVPPVRWPAVAWALVAPLRVGAGLGWLGRAGAAELGSARRAALGPVLRGVALGSGALLVFGALFLSADPAFANLAGATFDVQVGPGELLWRLTLAVGVLAVATALGVAQGSEADDDAVRPRRAPGVTELRIALGALVALFGLFVAVQLRVLFGGAGYVADTTGLGLGEYARQGFAQMLAVAALTLAVVGIAARRTDRVVRALLGALCVLCLLVLVSARYRLGLVVDAYGLTRLRVTGEAAVPLLGGLLLLVMAAGVRTAVARWAPRIAVTGTLAAVLAFSLSDPDRRVGERAVDRAARSGEVDEAMLQRLSADALPALRRLPEPTRGRVVGAVEARLARADGVAGFNVARARARARAR